MFEEIIALLRQKQLSPETIKMLLASDGANLLLINLLLAFLELHGVISRRDFISFLEDALAKAEHDNTIDENVRQILKIIVEGLSKDSPVLN
jgi:hypothetical protein